MGKNKEKIMVCYGLSDLRNYLKSSPNKKICLYLAEKTKEAWDISTSRCYMNMLDTQFIYLPVNIAKGDMNSIREVYKIAESDKRIVAINQTQPHKSNPVQREWFKGQDIPENVDSLIKDSNGKLQCYNLNGPSFTSWFEDEVCDFKNTTTIIFGVGGVGEPIARILATKKPKYLHLVDIFDKKDLASTLSQYSNTTYHNSINEIDLTSSNKLILINCAGKEGGNDESLKKILVDKKNKKHIFVDLRPQLNIDIVNFALTNGWEAYTGFGMNARNDYVLIEKIKEISGINIPCFKEFQKLVAECS